MIIVLLSLVVIFFVQFLSAIQAHFMNEDPEITFIRNLSILAVVFAIGIILRG